MKTLKEAEAQGGFRGNNFYRHFNYVIKVLNNAKKVNYSEISDSCSFGNIAECFLAGGWDIGIVKGEDTVSLHLMDDDEIGDLLDGKVPYLALIFRGETGKDRQNSLMWANKGPLIVAGLPTGSDCLAEPIPNSQK